MRAVLLSLTLIAGACSDQATQVEYPGQVMLSRVGAGSGAEQISIEGPPGTVRVLLVERTDECDLMVHAAEPRNGDLRDAARQQRRQITVSAPGARVGDLMEGGAQTLQARRGALFSDESTVYLELGRAADNDDGYATDSWYSVAGSISIDPLPCPGEMVKIQITAVQLIHEDGDDDSVIDGVIEATFAGTSDQPQHCPDSEFWCE